MATIVPAFSASLIAMHVERMAREIAMVGYSDFVLLTMLKGGAMLSADLARALYREEVRNFEMDYTSFSLYRDDMSERSEPEFTLKPSADVKARDVILVDDTCGTGETFRFMSNYLLYKGARSVALAVVIDATGKDRCEGYSPAFACFTLNEDAFFRVGYGEDVNGRHRELPFIGRYKE